MPGLSTGASTNAIIKSLRKTASNNPPKIDQMTGNRILSHGGGYVGICIACFVMVGMMFLISLAAPPWDDVGETVAFCLCAAFFAGSGIIGMLMVKISRVIVSPDGFTVRTPWYRRYVGWGDIVKVKYSAGSGSLVIKTSKNKLVRVSPGYNGIMYLIDRFDEHLSPEVFTAGAARIINGLKASVKDTELNKNDIYNLDKD